MEMIILAGGQGKRLRPLTHDLPKCMVPVNGHPMLHWHLQWINKYKIEKVVLACGYKWEKVKQHYGDKLVYSIEDEPLGTGGAIKLALDHIESDEFFVLNSDDINNVNLAEMAKLGANTIALSRFRSQFGIVSVEEGLAREFEQKPILPYWANMGLYLFSKKMDFPKKGAFEMELLPELAAKGELKAYQHTGYWVTINTMKELEQAQEFLKTVKI